MNDIMMLVLTNFEKIGIGVGIFLCAYVSNMGLGAWKNVKIDGSTFDWKLMGQSAAKFIVLGLSLSLLSMAISVLPAYVTYIGIEMEPETMNTIDSLVITSVFLSATIRYITDSISKVKTILGG